MPHAFSLFWKEELICIKVNQNESAHNFENSLSFPIYDNRENVVNQINVEENRQVEDSWISKMAVAQIVFYSLIAQFLGIA